MKIKLLTTVFVSILAFTSLIAQEEEFKPKGSVYGRVFFNYNMSFEEDETKSTFELQRAYLGYKYDLSKEFSTKVLFDVGSPEVSIGDTLKGGTNFQMTAFLKEGSLTYKKDNLTVEIGLIGLLQHKTPEALWNHRYVYKEFQDNNKMTTTADLGMQAQYKINDILSIDFMVRNGEGYRNIKNLDNSFRSGGGFLLTPIEGLIFRGYYDVEAKPIAQTSISHTLGYKTDAFSIGVDYSFQLNHKYIEDNTVGGFSFLGSYNINEKFQVFGRFDMFGSKTDGGPVFESNEYNLVIAGVQYTPLKNINVALDFQSKMPDDSSDDTENIVFVHCQYIF
jgi:hypothetical protein